MTDEKNNAAFGVAPKFGGASFLFTIDAFTPQNIPMVRLGEYMAALAQMLGEQEAVHFEKLTSGSTCLNLKVDREAAPKVRARAASVRRGDAPSEVMERFRGINKMLREDKGIARFAPETKGTVLTFPGREEVLAKPITVKQVGTFDGQLMRIGGIDATVHLMLVSEDQKQSKFVTNRVTAKRMAAHMFEHLRVVGRATWQRDEGGVWSLLEFKVDSFEVLNDARLTLAVADLRTIAHEWESDAIEASIIDRRGQEEA